MTLLSGYLSSNLRREEKKKERKKCMKGVKSIKILLLLCLLLLSHADKLLHKTILHSRIRYEKENAFLM